MFPLRWSLFCLILAGCGCAGPTNPSGAETLLDMSDATDNDQVHIFFATDGTITARVTDDARVAYDSVDPAGDYYDATWHHLSLVFDGATFKVYIDGGSPTSTAQSNINASVDPTEVWIGASYAASQFFNGHLAQVSISGSRAVTATEASWLADRMLKSLQVNPSGRKLHALDVDYVQSLGDYVVIGNQDSAIVWDAVLSPPGGGRSQRHPPAPDGVRGAGPDPAQPGNRQAQLRRGRWPTCPGRCRQATAGTPFPEQPKGGGGFAADCQCRADDCGTDRPSQRAQESAAVAGLLGPGRPGTAGGAFCYRHPPGFYPGPGHKKESQK